MCSSTTVMHERTIRKVPRKRCRAGYIANTSFSTRKNIEHVQSSSHRTIHGKSIMGQKRCEPGGLFEREFSASEAANLYDELDKVWEGSLAGCFDFRVADKAQILKNLVAKGSIVVLWLG